MTCERKNTFMANRIKKKEETKSSYQDNVALIMGVFTLAVVCCRWCSGTIILIFWRQNTSFTVSSRLRRSLLWAAMDLQAAK